MTRRRTLPRLYDGNGSLFGTLRAGNLLYTYTSDLSGSITNVVDTDQSAVVSYTYHEFGATTETQGGTFDNEVRFNGGVYDESTGFIT